MTVTEFGYLIRLIGNFISLRFLLSFSFNSEDIERFYECRKTKTRVITLASHKDTDNQVNQSKHEVITCS